MYVTEGRADVVRISLLSCVLNFDLTGTIPGFQCPVPRPTDAQLALCEVFSAKCS